MVLPQPQQAGPGPRTIQPGDLVVVYENFSSIRFLYADSKAQYNNRYGTFLVKDWLGRAFGCRVHARPPGQGWVHLLAPTPELWTQVLRHRTQILYAADIALVVAHLALRPGRVVLESGTGSGSLTHSLARAVAPGGHVHTYDFHALRAAEAAAEFGRHGLGGLVTVRQRNIEDLGFPQDLAGAAHAVFLDLPGPWKVVPSAAACLRPGGAFCSFSPCIEQVQRTCEALDRQGFTDIRTLEVLLRSYEVGWETLHTDAAAAPLPNKQGKKRSRPPAAAEEAGGGGGSGGAPAPAVAEEAAAAAAAAPAAAAAASVRQVLARPLMDARGHTGYLTFARRFVAAAPLDYGDEGDEGGEGGDCEGEGGGEEPPGGEGPDKAPDGEGCEGDGI